MLAVAVLERGLDTAQYARDPKHRVTETFKVAVGRLNEDDKSSPWNIHSTWPAVSGDKSQKIVVPANPPNIP